MGFFSWRTSDTKESIANTYSDHENAGRTVYLLQPDGKPPLVERGYEGYGVIGVDVYAWIGKMNGGPNVCDLDIHDDRDVLRRIGLELDGNKSLRYPLKLSFSKDAVYENLKTAENCEYQGFFYELMDF